MNRKESVERYRQFVGEGAGEPWNELHGQIYLGDDGFWARSKAMLKNRGIDTDNPSSNDVYFDARIMICESFVRGQH